MKYGEIWMVNFDPSVGHEYKRMRPAIIIQSNDVQEGVNCFTIMPITSSVHNGSSDDVQVGITAKNGLYCPSRISVGDIMTFDSVRFVKLVGIMEVETMKQITKYLRKHFAI